MRESHYKSSIDVSRYLQIHRKCVEKSILSSVSFKYCNKIERANWVHYQCQFKLHLPRTTIKDSPTDLEERHVASINCRRRNVACRRDVRTHGIRRESDVMPKCGEGIIYRRLVTRRTVITFASLEKIRSIVHLKATRLDALTCS